MKCPKCHYLSFEPEPRCRHCGYDFSMTDSPLPPMTPMSPITPVAAPKAIEPAPAALADLPLRDAADARPAGPAPASLGLMRPERPREVGRPAGLEAVPPARPQNVVPASSSPTGELPLFVKATSVPAEAREPEPPSGLMPLDRDPVRVPAAPPPLAVRRKSPDPVRAKPAAAADADRNMGPFDRDLLDDLKRIEADEVRRTQPDAVVVDTHASSRLARAGAAAIDLILLAALNSAIVWLTLRQTGLVFAELPSAALAPLIGFLWLVDLGYLLMFTASSGQTIGKMLLRLRVIDESEERLTVGRAAYRALLTFPSVLPLGAGFLPALFGGGALHDRLSHTRVVRA